MQLFSMASVAFLALAAVRAEDMASLHLRVSTGVSDWGVCTGGQKCSNPTSVCVKYSNNYSQCKPNVLPQGELCGQNDGTNVWKYDKCPSNQKCTPMGTDFRCTNKKHHKKSAKKDESCTITNESQCDGQNWTGSTCCADSSYECRWSDDGRNVKRCQKIVVDDDGSEDYSDNDDSELDDYNDIDDYSESDIDDYSESDYSDSDNSDSDDIVVVIIDDSGSDDIIDGGSNGTSYIDSGSDDYTSFVDDWADCSDEEVGCSNPTSVCVVYSDYYAQCKPETLPSGELCGQDDGTNVWTYDHCPSGETCQANGSDYRCKA
ncbi:unnamed protein product [Phytophthora lilii]|uniref:Unnamed protein product n=1 Tax=Phytophthora lilii TaxID=2077276 RepID=A0A9W6TUS4_9STRA|nr:unnamed protein product [Phytophthora lilii]